MIRRRTLVGPPIEAAGWRLRPIARAWELRLPGGRGARGGLVWLRPVAVLARGARDDLDRGAGGFPTPGAGGDPGHVRSARALPVRDATRLGQLALLAAGLLALFALRRRTRRRRPPASQ